VEEIWRKGSQSMRMLQLLKIGIFEQIKLDLTSFSSTNFPLKNSFTNIINNRLQNVPKGDALL